MKHVLLIACTVAATVVFTACDDAAPAPKAPAAPKAQNVSGKPAGVPSKVYKQVKGIEQQHNRNIQKQLGK